MTRRREVPTLAFTVREAAEAIRMSEHQLRAWVREGIVRVVRWNALDLVPRVELDRLINEAMNNNGTVPASAVADSPRGPAAAAGEPASGAAGPRDNSNVFGEVDVATVGRSGGNRPAAPTTKKAGASTPASLTTAG